jgi:hypothetical protein
MRAMGWGGGLSAGRDSSQVEFERIDGELDAAIVFAISAEQAYQTGNPEFCAACLSDARDICAITLVAFVKLNLPGAQLHDLKAKVLRLRQLLDRFRSSNARNEAA